MKIGIKIAKANKPFFSLEFFPPGHPEQLPGFFRMIENLAPLQPLFISVTYGAGGSARDKTLDITGQIAEMGFTTMAHLTCVGAEVNAIMSFLNELLARNVDNILALRGDQPQHAHEMATNAHFRFACDLVRFVHQQMPEMGIGVAAYPAPHPEAATFAADRAHTAEKIACGADFAITQLFFDVREYVALLNDLRARDITVPIIPGILPVQSFESLRKILSLCGANIPGKLYLQLEAANDAGGAGAVAEAGYSYAVNQVRQLLDAGAPGIHLYTLNKTDLCARLVKETGLAPV